MAAEIGAPVLVPVAGGLAEGSRDLAAAHGMAEDGVAAVLPHARAGAARPFGFHVCDWLVPTRDLLLDRGMMGDGVVDVPRIRRWMDAAGYAGPIEVEIFSAENRWRRDPAEVVDTARRRFADCA